MVFLRTPAQTRNNALKSAFLRSREREKEVSLSLSLSLSLFCSCRCCCCSNASRVVRFESEEEEEKKNDSENFFFFYAREKAQNILHTVFDFFSLSLVLVLSGRRRRRRVPPPREREREREVRASLQKRSSSLVSRNILVCALSLFFRCCSEYFLFFFFMQRKWIKKSGLWSFQIFSTGFFDSKSASLAFAPFNLRKNSRANDERTTNERDDGNILRTRDRERKKNKTLFIYHRTRIFLLWEIRVNNNSSTRSWRKCSPPSTKTKTYKTTIPRKG
jgi:hypothetical protein